MHGCLWVWIEFLFRCRKMPKRWQKEVYKFHHFMLGGILSSSNLRFSFSFSFSPSSRVLFKHVRPYQQSNDRTIACPLDQVEKKVPNVTILTHLLEWSISSPPAREDKTNHTDHDYFLSRKRFVGGGCINCKRK